jgi:macrolide transport system ATP-binding/permease protein
MRRLRATLIRLKAFLSRDDRSSRAFDAELESHLQLHTDDNIRAGMAPDEARRQAILKLGGIDRTRQAYRDQASAPILEHIVQDLQFALRHLVKAPGFTVTAVVTLALGFGAALAIYAFVDAALVEPLPYRDPSRLVEVTERSPQVAHANMSHPDYLDWKRQQTVFSGFDFHNGRRFSLGTPGGVVPVRGARVSPGFFKTLGVLPAAGRDFRDGDDVVNGPELALISDAAWHTYFGGRSDIVGRSVTLDGASCTILGILPASFHFALRGGAEFWVPFRAAGPCETNRSCHNLLGVARLKDGVSIEDARAEMVAIAARLEREYPGSNKGQTALVGPLAAEIVGDIKPMLLLLLGGAGLLLAIACVNVVSLLLVRSEGRKRELAVRSTLGASNGRLIRQFVTEAFVLVVLGAGSGIVAAVGGIRLLFGLMSEDMRIRMPFLAGVGINWRVCAVAAALSAVALLIFTMAPALRVRVGELRDGLTEGSRGSSGNAWRRLGFKLVVFELATAMVLLVGAGLLGQSLYRLLNVDLGFDPDALVTLQVAAPVPRLQEKEAAHQLDVQVVERVGQLPGVRSVALVDLLPVTYNGNTDWIRFVGRPYSGEHNEVLQRTISAAYFATVGARIARGRAFTDADRLGAPRVAVINKALARKYFPNEDPIGKRVGNSDLAPDSLKEIVGVVEDIHEGTLSSENWPAVYYAMEQDPTSFFAIVARTSAGTEQAVLPAVSPAVRAIDPDVITSAPAVMRQRIEDSPAAYLQRSSTWLVGGFAALALLMGVIGLYGVIAYSVSQRTREIGLRLALGAERRMVYELILGEAGRLVLAGLVIGAGASVAAGVLMRTLLFGTEPWDVPTLAGVAGVLAVAALVASFIPARRAASVDPIEALRTE